MCLMSGLMGWRGDKRTLSVICVMKSSDRGSESFGMTCMRQMVARGERQRRPLQST